MKERLLGNTSAWRYGRTSLDTFENRQFSGNDMFNPAVVCFCDIPLSDIGIHTKKYSEFGIGFDKKFLIHHGANPVYYVARSSGVRVTAEVSGEEIDKSLVSKSGLTDHGFEMISRTSYEDRNMIHFHSLYNSMEQQLRSTISAANEAGAEFSSSMREYKNTVELRRWLELYYFSFVKFFDPDLPDDHEDNYYMEREWRTLHYFRFDLMNIKFVVLPRRYLHRFRTDITDYYGSVIAVEDVI
jgi:hypothetical protein